jgi:hypothetical protein
MNHPQRLLTKADPACHAAVLRKLADLRER